MPKIIKIILTEISMRSDFTAIPNTTENTMRSFLYSFFMGLKNEWSRSGSEKSEMQYERTSR